MPRMGDRKWKIFTRQTFVCNLSTTGKFIIFSLWKRCVDRLASIAQCSIIAHFHQSLNKCFKTCEFVTIKCNRWQFRHCLLAGRLAVRIDWNKVVLKVRWNLGELLVPISWPPVDQRRETQTTEQEFTTKVKKSSLKLFYISGFSKSSPFFPFPVPLPCW